MVKWNSNFTSERSGHLYGLDRFYRTNSSHLTERALQSRVEKRPSYAASASLEQRVTKQRIVLAGFKTHHEQKCRSIPQPVAASRVHLSRLDGPIQLLQVLMRTGLQLPQNLLDQLNETPGD